MAKTKLSLTVAPTFRATVAIPTPGGKPADVEFVFRHRTRDELKEFIDDGASSLEGDVELVMGVASGWELDDPFDAQSVEKLTQNYIGSAQAIYGTYLAELTGARVKN